MEKTTRKIEKKMKNIRINTKKLFPEEGGGDDSASTHQN